MSARKLLNAFARRVTSINCWCGWRLSHPSRRRPEPNCPPTAPRPARLLRRSGRRNQAVSPRWRSCALLTRNRERGSRPVRLTHVLSELIDEIGGNAQVAGVPGSQQNARLHVAVKIRSAGYHQAVALRQAQILFRIPAGVIAMVGFDRIETGIAELR